MSTTQLRKLCAALLMSACALAVHPPAEAKRDEPTTVRVATLNVKNVTFDRAKGAVQPWAVRRDVIVAQVLAEQVDVLGIQEANQSRYQAGYVQGRTQYLDLLRGLNKAGGNYRLTSKASYNCANGRTANRCVARDRAASRSSRILYDADRVALVSRGALLYRKQDRTGTDRYLAWAIFRTVDTGRQFLFTTTHLSTADKITVAQWRQSVRFISSIRGDLPVIATGDYNASRNTTMAAKMLPVTAAADLPDTLGQQPSANPVALPRAASTVNAWVNSFNHDRADVKKFSHFDRQSRTGSMIDWIFASGSVGVSEWKVVLDFDPVTFKVNGVLPSDHNMIRATLALP